MTTAEQRKETTADLPSGRPLPSVSVIVPTHQRPALLSQLLESIRALTYPHHLLEVIVVGGARDPGRYVVESAAEVALFPLTYKVVSDEALGSASIKRNVGARSARGEVLAFTDDDCIVHPDWVRAAVPWFEKTGTGGVEGSTEIPRPSKPTLTYSGSLRLSMAGGFQTCNVFYRRSVFEECGGFDEAFPYYLEDTDLAYSVMERGYSIPFAAEASVDHPVQPGRPLKVLSLARTAQNIPYLLHKHPASRRTLRQNIKVLNRSHYPYLVLYAAGIIVGLAYRGGGFAFVGSGLAALVPLHLAYIFWRLHFTLSELLLTGLCQPVVPVLRLWYWVKGLVRMRVGTTRQP